MSTELRRQLEASLAITHSRHAWRRPQTLRTIGRAAEWIEPMLSRDDAISEARRIAEEESIFGTGYAWSFGDRWYAADFRPCPAPGIGIGFGEIVTVEIGKPDQSDTSVRLWA